MCASLITTPIQHVNPTHSWILLEACADFMGAVIELMRLITHDHHLLASLIRSIIYTAAHDHINCIALAAAAPIPRDD